MQVFNNVVIGEKKEYLDFEFLPIIEGFKFPEYVVTLPVTEVVDNFLFTTNLTDLDNKNVSVTISLGEYNGETYPAYGVIKDIDTNLSSGVCGYVIKRDNDIILVFTFIDGAV